MHYTTRRFWQCYHTLPQEVQKTADQCYDLLKRVHLIHRCI